MHINLPKIIGHRGVKDLAPENTIHSIKEASKHGIKWVEVDVKTSKDNIPFLLHDDLLDRTTSGRGFANNYTYEEIKQLDAGSWFNSKYCTAYPPSLEEVLNYCYEKNLGINIELKPNIGREKDNVDSVCLLLNKIKLNIQHYFSSFDYYSLQLLRQRVPNASLGYLIHSFNKKNTINSIIKDCVNLNFFSIGFDIKIINKKIINVCKKHNLQVTVYSDQNIKYHTALKLWNIGVNSIFVDNPIFYEKDLKN